MNCLSVHQTIAFQCAIIQCPKQESGTLRLNVHFSNANRLIQLAILVKHQKRVLKHYEGQFFESQTLPLRELYGYTEIYRRMNFCLCCLFVCLFIFQGFKNHLITAKARRELLSLRVYVALTEICNLRHACLLEFQ